MTTGKIPYDEIYETRDRAWTMRLLERLVEPDVDQAEIDEIEGVFQFLCDPRAVEPCIQIAENLDFPSPVRNAAAATLISVEPEIVRRWRASEDDVLREWGFRLMKEAEFRPIVEQVASDPEHEFHKIAVGATMTLTFGFKQPRHIEMKLAALGHSDAEVREAAVFSLLWDEPVVAEEPLIQATYDSDVTVVESAANTLRYYPTQRVFLRLSELTEHTDETVRNTAEEAVNEIRDRILYAVSVKDEVVRGHIRRWLEPIWKELDFSEEELLEEEGISVRREQPILSVLVNDYAKELLANPDTSVHALDDLFSDYDWNKIAIKDRPSLTELLLHHPDWAVRQSASRVFEAWGDQESLKQLMADQDRSVRREATRHLSQTPPFKQEIADFVWDYMHERFDPNAGEYEGESLSAYTAHAKREEAIPRLLSIAKKMELTEDQRTSAVNRLEDLEATDALAELMAFISDPPPLTWMFHEELLECAEKFDLTIPDISHLVDVDHLDVQRAIAPFISQQVRNS